jgi:L-ascorbate metabolism protein UlaG (beta-lactamase superfamily)
VSADTNAAKEEGMLGVCVRAAMLLIVVFWAQQTAAQPVTRFTSIERLTNSEVQLRLNVTSSYRINVSTNLARWEPLVSALRQSTQYVDAGALYRSNRFYTVLEATETNFLAGDHILTDDGEVIVHPVDHASFVMRWKDKMIYNDPVGANSLYSSFPKADLVLVSHSHSDHFNASSLSFVRATNGVIIAPQAVFSQLSTTLRAATIVLTNGAATNVNGVQIEAVPAYNGNHPRGTGNGYVLTLGGKRFFMSGDTGAVAEIRALEKIDVAFLCMNIPFTMNVNEAASVARDFKPRILYPYHYRNGGQPVTYADLNLLKRLIGTEHGIEVRVRQWY